MKRAAIVLVFLVACGSSAMSEEDKEAFIAGCTAQAPDTFTDEQLAELTDLCECSADKAVEEGITDPDEITAEKSTEWAQECAEE